jgi:Nucleotidyl transferase AbiEii toxin, Type IV TA system
MDSLFYFERLYPFQDAVLAEISVLETPFYLAGGTAASRGYLEHRFSDDLDLFVNDDAQFVLWTDRIVQALRRSQLWHCEVTTREERFVRLSLSREEVSLKIEFMNDVPSHAGNIRLHPILGRLDSPENLLANKVAALLDRQEPKDFADVWGFCCQLKLSLLDAIQNSQSKAAGIFPADLARLLCQASRTDWELIRWISAPPFARFQSDLIQLGESLVLR